MSVNDTLSLYRNCNPPGLSNSDDLQSFFKNIPKTHKSYADTIDNKSIKTKTRHAVEALTKELPEVLSLQSECNHQSLIAGLLDPPVKALKESDNSILGALYLDDLETEGLSKWEKNAHWFHTRDLFSSSQETTEQGHAIIAAHQVMKYALSQAEEAPNIPVYTQQISRAVLNGQPNPLDNLEKIKLLGRGNYGTVHLVKTSAEIFYASKNFQNTRGAIDQAAFNHEYHHLTSVSGTHIIKLIHAQPPMLLLEFAEHGPITTKLSPETTLKAINQIAAALANMHDTQKIIHGDLTFNNILLDENDNIKIADLGLSFFKNEFPDYMQKVKGSIQVPYYLPPELLTADANDLNCEKIDVWSFGMVLWNFLKKDDIQSPILTTFWGPSPFHGFSKEELLNQLNPDKLHSLDAHGSLTALMIVCLELNPANRPTMKEIHLQLSPPPIRIITRDSAVNSAPPYTPSPVFSRLSTTIDESSMPSTSPPRLSRPSTTTLPESSSIQSGPRPSTSPLRRNLSVISIIHEEPADFAYNSTK